MKRKLATRLVHGVSTAAPGVADGGSGGGGDSRLAREWRPTAPAIQPASAFVYDESALLHESFVREEGYVYSRHANPTVAELEACVAGIEGEGARTVAFGSGMGAMHAAVVAALRAQGEGPAVILASRDLYGATIQLLRRYVASESVRVELADLVSDPGAVATLRDRQARKLVVLELISNPLLRVADLDAIVAAARSAGAFVLVDNTFATPCLSRPLERGADLVVHSATKYFGGHGDATGGVASTTSPVIEKELRLAQRFFGGMLGPFEAWTILRGMRTLELRLERQCENAMELAQLLRGRPRITKVHYPGLPGDPSHETAKRMLDGFFGAMVAFEIADAKAEDVERFFDRLELVVPATTLGDVSSLVLYPARSSHRTLTPEERAERGITDGLVRLSCGIEGWNDVLADLENALG